MDMSNMNKMIALHGLSLFVLIQNHPTLLSTSRGGWGCCSSGRNALGRTEPDTQGSRRASLLPCESKHLRSILLLTTLLQLDPGRFISSRLNGL